jgi:hypothetical protein
VWQESGRIFPKHFQIIEVLEVPGGVKK